MVLSLIYVMIFAISGVFVSAVFFPHEQPKHRFWLGLVFGLFLWIWLPSLLAFFIGFTLTAQIGAGIVAVIIATFSYFLRLKKKQSLLEAHSSNLMLKSLLSKLQLKPYVLIALLGIFILGCYLFSTHILRTDEFGYWVGQTTYGDLSMHLGFISSIAEQGKFPPDYNIFVGQPINYPFLNETPASTLVLLGSNLRQAYLISAIYAYALVILGVYFFFEQWLKRQGRSLLATLLFFFGSGFGFYYFLNTNSNSPSNLSNLLGATSIGNNWQNWLDGFYITPTNLPLLGLRWVNPIVDMLIPQRATLFGWAFLFPCLFLLMGWTFQNKKSNLVPLAVLAGGLPLIHTHSFLALGVISAGYLCLDFTSKNIHKKRLLGWLIYGGVTLLLALPQLIKFTFVQAAESSMLKFHFNWANETDNFIWFYVKNLGWLCLLAIPAFVFLSKRDRRIMSGPIVLWILSEFVVFQPNTYDNNKLLFVSFAFLCGLVARFIAFYYRKLNHKINFSKKLKPAKDTKKLLNKFSFSAKKIAIWIACTILAITTFLSSTMTIIREIRSNYQVFGIEEIEAAEYIKQETSPDALFLTDANFHWNVVSSLTGRNIVCGTNTFLYFHGIDTTERHNEVTSMFQNPAETLNLYEKYNVDYVLIGKNERHNYNIDFDFLAKNFTQVFQNNTITIYSTK